MYRPQVNIALGSPEGERLHDAIRAHARRVGTTESTAARQILQLGVAALGEAGSARPPHEHASVNVLLGALSDELEKIEDGDAAAALGLAVGSAVALIRYATQRGVAYGLDDAGVMRPAIEAISAALGDVALDDPQRGERCAAMLAEGVSSWASKEKVAS